MKSSVETRWFYHETLPADVRKWFCGSSLCRDDEARTDQYLVLPGSNEVGVRIREGRKLEIKARTGLPQPLSLETGVSVGRQDTWVKWSHDDREVVSRLAAFAGGSPEWLAVTKKRWIRKFHFDAAGNVEEIDPDAKDKSRCRVELAELNARGSSWWTMAFESQGQWNRAVVLEPFALHLLRMLPHGLALTERDSMAYPEWLNRVGV
jgi:hypothetical protein